MARGIRGSDFRIDISILGDKELSKKLRRLAGKEQRRIVRLAMRESAKRVKARVIANISGKVLDVRTGALLKAFKEAPIQNERSRVNIRLGIVFPTREALGLDRKEPYYPVILEVGYPGFPKRPYLRPAVDNHKTEEYRLIGNYIGRAIERLALRR